MDVVVAASVLGAGLGMGLGAIGSAIGEGYAAGRTIEAISRQPATTETLTWNMLVGQAIAETSGIFALVMAAVLLFTVEATGSWAHAAALLGAGVSIGLGALGSGVGSGLIAGGANAAAGRNPPARDVTLRMMFIAQAMCQTTTIYALLISVLLWVLGPGYSLDFPEAIPRAAALLGAGAAAGFGAIGPALGTAEIGRAAAEGIGAFGESESRLTQVFFVGSAVSQTTGIYALVVALLLIFVV